MRAFTALSQLGNKSCAALGVLVLLAGCAGAPQEKKTQQPVAPALPSSEISDFTAAMPDSQYNREFAAADTALAKQDWMNAETALVDLPAVGLDANDLAHLGYLRARIAHVRGEPELAANTLQDINRPGLHPAIAYRVHNFQRHLMDLEGDYLGSARLGASIIGSAPTADRPALKRSIWLDLQRVTSSTLQQAGNSATEPQWSAWLELATLANRDMSHLTTQLPAWLANNPDHPAANPLPGGLQYLLQPTQQANTVALMLPLSGRLAPAGKAVRDGYLASYYQARRGNQAPFEVLVLDTDLYESATTAYQDAIGRGAELVVGPLSKESVGELAMNPARTVPVIALNQIESNIPPGNSALVQLSLAPEDEAMRIAELAFGQGARRALVLRPAGPWGDKLEIALRQRWQSLGGSTSSVISYTGQDDYSGSVKSGLGIAASEARKQQLRNMLATNVEFTPRRRQDLDAIFMLARNGAEARALKPLLAFHYAGALPVYATSSVYSGSPDPRDKDLDGLQLVDLPWLLGSNPALKNALASSGSDQYTRLNALGADAYRLQSHIVQLRAGPDALLRGDTGLLSLSPQLQIQRELPAAVFDGGALKPR